jgi:glutathione S-transferase
VKFYNALGPNPRLVRMFMAEKGIEIPEMVEVDLMGGENRAGAYREMNPFGQLPALELDDGTVLAETVAICSYLDAEHPEPPLFGTTAAERAETLMWAQRAVLNVTEPMSNGFRFAEGLTLFKDRMHCMPAAADDFKTIGRNGLALFDQCLDGRQWLAGDRFSFADILLYGLVDFFYGVGQPRNSELKNLDAWHERMSARPSAEASLHPAANSAGMRG